MVAPAIIAGLGIIASGLANVVLGKKKPGFAVVRFARGVVVGKMFDDVAKAEAWQEQLSKAGKGSIIVQRIPVSDGKGHTYTSLHPVQGMKPAKGMRGIGAAFTVGPAGYWLVKWRAPGSTKEHLEIFPWEREAAERERDLRQMAAWVSKSMIPHTKRTVVTPKPIKKMGSFKPPYDTREAQEKEMLLTTRFPAPERFIRANEGPYPEEGYFEPQKLVEVPNFDDTTSSHEWKTSVVPDVVRDYNDSAGHSYKGQPEVLEVVHRDQADGAKVPVKPW